MAFGGFLQWFILVPRFLQKPDLTLLKLGTSSTLTSPGSQDTDAAFALKQSSQRLCQSRLFSKYRRRSSQKLCKVVSKRIRTRREID